MLQSQQAEPSAPEQAPRVAFEMQEWKSIDLGFGGI